MQIPSYQIQNVLKVYSRQLSQGKILTRNKFISSNEASADSVSISSEGKRQAIIDKVAANIVDKIITEGPKEKSEAQITDQIEKELGKKINFTRDKNQFTYTAVDKDNNKVSKTLSVEDSKFVLKRMTELARQVADNNMES
ncbi:DVU0524 family FlgM-associated protein [Desulfospira joergensenii]|uniref:DVU0524 family FlgM-associated protein n=1 Tax=Desulfospira joergensenii TaxID=53329 RepID=UPI0003B58385|nr:DVU0524 family FlgM-associated protein [Desulfospira joergensenii]